MAEKKRSPTAQEFDGIVIDLNLVTRLEFRQLLNELNATDDDIEKDKLSGKFYEKVVVSWPFEQPVSEEGYLALGYLDGNVVDNAFNRAAEAIAKKK